MPTTSLGADFFDRMYADTDDPWHFATSEYEHAKYRATIAALGGRRFGRALEVGCSIGVLTAALAARCDTIVALDINERALRAASTRCATLPGVRFERAVFPREIPVGPFDLVVVSEVGYYWDDEDLALAIDRIARLAAGGWVELVHYLPRVPEYVRDGDAVHAEFLADHRFTSVVSARAERYRLDLLRVS